MTEASYYEDNPDIYSPNNSTPPHHRFKAEGYIASDSSCINKHGICICICDQCTSPSSFCICILCNCRE